MDRSEITDACKMPGMIETRTTVGRVQWTVAQHQ